MRVIIHDKHTNIESGKTIPARISVSFSSENNEYLTAYEARFLAYQILAKATEVDNINLATKKAEKE